VRPKSEAKASHSHYFNYLNPQSPNLVAHTQLALLTPPEQDARYARFDAHMLCWMYRRSNHFGEDGKAAEGTFRFSKSFSGKACPKLTT
jgi:hypothetical protein